MAAASNTQPGRATANSRSGRMYSQALNITRAPAVCLEGMLGAGLFKNAGLLLEEDG